MLDGVRVLDLTDRRGNLASMILAGLGAEVIAVEPPTGIAARMLSPFAGGVPDPDRSLVHWATNRGKRSIVLDPSSATDRGTFADLVANADILFSDDPARLSELGIEPVGHNPRLIHVAMSGFGIGGPKSDWAAPDLVALAAGGQLRLSGDADRAPLRCSVPQAWVHTSGDAADAALIALHERHSSGLGQVVDISAQQSVMQATQSLVLNHAFGVEPGARVGGGMRLGPIDVRLVWPCLDGTVTITFLFGAAVGPFSHRLFQWIWEEGQCDEATRDSNWVELGNQIHTGEVPVSEFERLKDVLAAFCLTKTKSELFDAALERKLLIAPASSIADVFDTAHFHERDYWDSVDQPQLGRAIRQPGPIVKPSFGRLPTLGRAPLLGEHTEEILAELDRNARDDTPTAHAPSAGGEGRGPLAGLKVLDFMWSLAGPAITRVLADYGATVVRIESSARIEMGRTLNPFWQDKTDPEGSGVFLNANAGKLGVCLDLNTEEGREVARDLAKWADVVTESYSPTAMRRWGLDYENLRKINPSLIMMSSSLAGNVGPLSNFAGFGNLASALAGFFNTTGWPDRTCVGPYGGYTDYLSPRFAIAALLAGLERRRATGEGVDLDFSQAEGAMWALGPAFAEFEANGDLWGRTGNTDRNLSPHLVAPTAGDDRWIAVVCESDDQWRTLCDLAGFGEDLADLNVDERLARNQEIEDLISAWTATQSAGPLSTTLQAAGIPAHELVDAVDLWNDEHLAQRNHWVWVEHDKHGQIPLEGSRFRMSRTPAPPIQAPPTLGQHAFQVLTEIVGYDTDRIAELAANEILE